MVCLMAFLNFMLGDLLVEAGQRGHGVQRNFFAPKTSMQGPLKGRRPGLLLFACVSVPVPIDQT